MAEAVVMAAQVRSLVFWAAVLLLSASESWATAIPSWTFNEDEITTRPADIIRITGTLLNDPVGDEDLIVAFIAPSGSSGAPPGIRPLSDAYDFGFPFIHLDFVELAPGESYSFEWTVLAPRSGKAPLGVYGPAEASILIPQGTLTSDNLFTVWVVPEPGHLGLVGLLAVLGLRRLPRRKAS